MKKVCRELMDFFQGQEGWDKSELLADYCAEILKQSNCTINSQALSPDEIELNWGDDRLPVTLQDFADALFDKIIEGVCNVIETA